MSSDDEVLTMTDRIRELASELAAARGEIAQVKGKLELLNRFYASDVDENENEKLVRATKELVDSKQEIERLKEVGEVLADAAMRMMNNSSGGWNERAELDAAIIVWRGAAEALADKKE